MKKFCYEVSFSYNFLFCLNQIGVRPKTHFSPIDSEVNSGETPKLGKENDEAKKLTRGERIARRIDQVSYLNTSSKLFTV